MLHDTATVTRTKALVTAPTALVIARAVSHGRQIQPHYPVIDRAADRAICDVLDEHYDAAGGIPFQSANLIHNHRGLLDFEQHCTSTAASFAVDIWQFNRAGLVDAAVSACSRVGTRAGTLDEYNENHVYFRGSTRATMITASSWNNTDTMPGTNDLDTLLFDDSGGVVVGLATRPIPVPTLARDVEIHTISGPDIAAADWNLPPAGTDLGFDTAWPDGVVRGVYEFHRSN